MARRINTIEAHPAQIEVLDEGIDDANKIALIDPPPQLALTNNEIRLLDHLFTDVGKSQRTKTLSHYLTKLARLGGCLARVSDPPPGNNVMWRGLSRLTDIELGVEITVGIVGD